MLGPRTFAAVCLASLAGFEPAAADEGLEQARRNYPALILGGNVRAVSDPRPRACPSGGRVEWHGGPTVEYLGANSGSPDLCLMRIGGQPVQGWFGIWLTVWPGADMAHAAMGRLIRGSTGDVEAFDVRMAPGFSFHEVMHNEGVEDIRLLGTVYRAMKLSHYREGAEGSTYRSVSTAWKDLASGMIVYVTYHHISGAPEIQVPLIPSAIVSER